MFVFSCCSGQQSLSLLSQAIKRGEKNKETINSSGFLRSHWNFNMIKLNFWEKIVLLPTCDIGFNPKVIYRFVVRVCKEVFCLGPVLFDFLFRAFCWPWRKKSSPKRLFYRHSNEYRFIYVPSWISTDKKLFLTGVGFYFFFPAKVFAGKELGGGGVISPLGINSCATQVMIFLCHVLNNFKFIQGTG